MTGAWAVALATFLDVAGPVDVEWMLVGSAATRVHGAAVEPGDVDVLVHPDTEDAPLVELADRLTSVGDQVAPGGDDLATAVSTRVRPLASAGGWTLGRWYVSGGKLEVARIRDNLDTGIVETQGRSVWDHRSVVTWRGRPVPVVPLEVQWATFALRGQGERMAAVRAIPPARGDAGLAHRALAARGLDPGISGER